MIVRSVFVIPQSRTPFLLNYLFNYLATVLFICVICVICVICEICEICERPFAQTLKLAPRAV